MASVVPSPDEKLSRTDSKLRTNSVDKKVKLTRTGSSLQQCLSCACGKCQLVLNGEADVKAFHCECAACRAFYAESYRLAFEGKFLTTDVTKLLIDQRGHVFAEMLGMYDADKVSCEGETEVIEDDPAVEKCLTTTPMLRYRCAYCKMPVYTELKFEVSTLVIAPARYGPNSLLQHPAKDLPFKTATAAILSTNAPQGGCCKPSKIKKRQKRIENIQRECASKSGANTWIR